MVDSMKRILTILIMITCILGLTACGDTDTTQDPRTPQLLETGEGMVNDLYQIVSQGAEEQFAANDVTYNGILGFKDALEDIGEYKGTNSGTVTFDGDEFIIEINVLGSVHDAVVEFIFDNSGSASALTSITTNVNYSLGELMKNAALNTVIGMGTVFAVLILISLIIACFSLISKAQGRQKKEETAASAPKAAAPVVKQPAASEELADDTELAAVIAAAVAAYEGAGSTDGFVVRSIRKSNKSKWQNA